MKLNFIRVFICLVLFIKFVGCVVNDRYLDEKSEPMLQVDATLFAGEPITDIKIRKVFDIHASDPFEKDRNELWASGASVLLYEVRIDDSGTDSLQIPLRERSNQPGRFDTVDPDYRIKPERSYVLKVDWDGLSAYATARIPDYRIEKLNIKTSQPEQLPDTLLFLRDQIGFAPPQTDTLIVYKTGLEMEQPIPYNHVSYQITTKTEKEALQLYPRFRFDVRDPLKYHSINIEENENRFTHQQIMNEYYDIHSSLTERSEMIINIVMIVPESIYGDYIEADPSYLVPVFVSNVEGGAGLFIGAVRDTVVVRVPIVE